ncbi:hypothetical protein SLA2020_287270 [Shorea laevis]
MDPRSFRKLCREWDIFLVNDENNILLMETALPMLLMKDPTPIEGWDLNTIVRCWIKQVVVQKGVDPTPYLPPPPEWIPLPQLQAPNMCLTSRVTWTSTGERLG